MDASVLAQDLHKADSACLDPASAAQVCRDPAASPSDRDAALLVLVSAYRADSSWAAVLLELLDPEMAQRRKHFRAQPPVISHSDIRMQLTVEVLKAAAQMPLPPDARRVGYRIVRRAGWMVNRWLLREARYQEPLAPLPEGDEDQVGEERQ